MCLSPASSP